MDFSSGRGRRSPVEINLTPLIDVVFILLVFFMLASSYLDWKVVDLRISAAGGKAKSAERSFVVRLGTDGSMTLDARSVTPDQVRERVAAISSPKRTSAGRLGEVPAAMTKKSLSSTMRVWSWAPVTATRCVSMKRPCP